MAKNNPVFHFSLNLTALGEAEGTAMMSVSKSWVGWNTLVAVAMQEKDRQERIEVPVMRLDKYLQQKKETLGKIGLMKIDVEGFELFVLKGLSGFFEQRDTLPPILCEVSPSFFKRLGIPVKILQDYMHSYGYQAYSLLDLKTKLDLTQFTISTDVLFQPGSAYEKVSSKRQADEWVLSPAFSNVLVIEEDPASPAARSYARTGAAVSSWTFDRPGAATAPAFPDRSFDLAVFHGALESMRPDRLHELRRVLKSDGSLCLRGTGRFELRRLSARLKTAGFQIKTIHAPLPHNQNPLYLVDLNGREGLAYLADTLPQRRVAKKSWRRILFTAAKLAARCQHLGLFLMRELSGAFILTASPKSPAVAEEPLKAISRSVFTAVHNRDISFLIHSGLELITVAVLAKGKKDPVGIIRVSRERGSKTLKREFEILSHIKNSAPQDFLRTVPAPLGWHTTPHFEAFSMSFLAGREKRLLEKDGLETLEVRLIKVRTWLGALSRIPVPESAAISNRFREARMRLARLALSQPATAEIRPVLDKALNAEALARQVPGVITHRDLGAANLLFDAYGDLRVIDWGNSHYGYPLTDWLRFTGYFLFEIYDGENMAACWKELLLGKSGLSRLFYRETRELCQNLPAPDWAAPLFLLSLFDFLEGFHLYSELALWEKDYDFLFSQSAWLEALRCSARTSAERPK